jgi:hypothetical protein
VFRRFLIAIVLFLVVVVIAADRVGAVVAAHVLAGKVQTDEHLPHRPSASIGGIPFLTQAFGGKYKDVKITGHDVPVNGVNVTTLTVHLKGVHLSLSKALGGSVSQLPVDHATGTAFLSFADADSYLAAHRIAGSTVSLRPGSSGKVVVLDKVRFAGQAVSLRGVGSMSVDRNTVSVGATQLTGAPLGSAGRALLNAASRRLHISFPLLGLPFRLQLTSVAVSSSGLTGTGSATHIVLGGSGG